MRVVYTCISSRFEKKRDKMEALSSDKYLEMLMFFMEEKKLYLNKDLSSQEIALLLKIKRCELNNLLYESLGINIDQMISMYRIQHARELLFMGVKYKELWKFSGFISQSSMESAFQDVVD